MHSEPAGVAVYQRHILRTADFSRNSCKIKVTLIHGSLLWSAETH